MNIKCPRCKSQLEVDAIGDFVACFHCSLEFTVDEPTVDEPTVDESQKTKSLIEKTYNPPVLDNQPVLNQVSKPSSVLTMPVRGSEPNYVVVTDIKMKFSSMVEFMIMWVFASIPAIIVLGFFFGLAGILLGIIGGRK